MQSVSKPKCAELPAEWASLARVGYQVGTYADRSTSSGMRLWRSRARELAIAERPAAHMG
jgi:hypothetical protein